MDQIMSTLEREARPLRPVARWVQERDETGRDRLVMVWSVPDPHMAMLGLDAAQA
jgi:hypothetical protein